MLLRMSSILEVKLGLTNMANHKVQVSNFKNNLVYLANPIITVQTGKEKGEVQTEGVLRPNTLYHLSFGQIRPEKHLVLIDLHPSLCEIGGVSCPRMVVVGDQLELKVGVFSPKQIDIGELPWILRMGMIMA